MRKVNPMLAWGRRVLSPIVMRLCKWLCLVLLLAAGQAQALNCTSNGGDWTTVGTWGNCNNTTPQAADTVQINAGTVILNTSTTIAGLTVSGGTLTIGNSNAARTLVVSGNILVASGAVNIANNNATHVLRVGGDITNNGTFDLQFDNNSRCTTNFTGGGTHTIGGTSAGTTEFYNVTVANDLIINKSGAAIAQTGTLSVTGSLSVQAGTINVANSITVTGTTSISGTINHTNTTGTRTFTGDVTINNGGTMSEAAAEPIAYGGNVIVSAGGTLTEFGAATMTFAGSLQNDGAYTASTGAHTFSGGGKTFSGLNPIVISSVTVSGTYTNSGTLTVEATLAGGGTLTNGASGTLNIGAASVTPTLVAIEVGNTVNYNGTAQTVKPTAYYNLGLSGNGTKTMTNVSTVGGNLSLSNSAVATTAIAMNIGGNLDVGTGSQFTVAGFNISVTGATSVTGTLTHSSAAGAKTYTGNVTVNNGGTWNEGAAAAISFGGDLHNDGTLSAAGGVHTFTGANKTFGGANAISIPSATVSGTYTNDGTLTVSTTLAGGGTLTNGAAGTLNIGATTVAPTLVASLIGNTVNYTGAAQTVKAASYHHLGVSGSLAKTLGGDVTVVGQLTLSAGTFVVGANTLTLNGPGIAGAVATTGLTTTSSSNLVFGGSSAGVTLPGSVTALNNLTISNSSGVTMGGASVSMALSGTLALGANTLTTGSNTLDVSGDCSASGGHGSVTRVSGYVIGNLRLRFPLTVTSNTCIYHVGDTTVGGGYAPITVTVGPTTGGTLTGRVDTGDHPDTVSSVSGLDPAKSANHYWTLTAGSISTSVTYDATFQFCADTGSCLTPAEVDASDIFGNFTVARKLSGTWTNQTTPAGDRGAYSTKATGIIGFGEFAVGEINLCFAESFTGADGASPGANWSVGSLTGTFGNPVIWNTGGNGRLRITNASANVATWATLQRPFPSSGNKVTLQFQHFAYGGTGADGMAVVLSDASVAAQVGAFGGSLGYAQKAAPPASDCANPAGCAGFSGGWLGIGLDEYGNYSTNLEGRYGGSGTRVLQSVAMRGSGSGLAGYRFIAGTGGLSPQVDVNDPVVPPSTAFHQYRITVDHTDGIHAWAKVERSINGGASYATLLGPLDVLDPGYSQNPIPNYLSLSFTGSTGSSNNIHEIDNLNVCTVQGLGAPALHHIRLQHGGAACTTTPADVIVKACANAACTSLYAGNVTVDLSNIAGATWSADPVTFTGGQTTVTLTKGTTGAVSLGGTATSPTTGNPTRCFNGATETSCTNALTFSACTFDAIEVGAAAATNIYTKLAGTAFNLDLLSLAGGTQTVTAVNLVNASSGTCATYPILASTTTTLPLGFTNTTTRWTVAFTYNNAAPNVRVRITSGGGATLSCSTDNFVIRPQTIALTSSANNGSTPPGGTLGVNILRAGRDPFSLTATVVNNAYDGTPTLNSSLVTSGQANQGTLTSVAFPAATVVGSTAVSTVSGFKYSEVGTISLAQYAVYDATFANVDSVKGDCTPGFSNTEDASHKFSCQFGSAVAGPFGRFVPDHFTVAGAIANACTSGTFTYMGQPFTLSPAGVVRAENAASGVTQNYVGAYAPGTVSFGAENADDGINLAGSLSYFPSGAITGTWTAGVYTLTGTAITFARALAGPYNALDIGLTVTDPDVSTSPAVAGADMNPAAVGGSFSYKKFSGSPLRMRFGRLRLISGQGSERAKYTMQTEVQYWGGTYWRTNTDDSCTTYAAGNFAVPVLTTVSSARGINQGYGSVVLTEPTASGIATICMDMASTADGCTGSPDASLSYLRGNWGASTYDKDPSATVLFGGANSNSRGNWGFLYRRENF